MPNILSRTFSSPPASKRQTETLIKDRSYNKASSVRGTTIDSKGTSSRPTTATGGFRVVRREHNEGEGDVKQQAITGVAGLDRKSPPRHLSPLLALDGPYPTRSVFRSNSALPHSSSASSLSSRNFSNGRPTPYPRQQSNGHRDTYSQSLPIASSRFPSRRVTVSGSPVPSSFLDNPAVDRYPRPYVTPKNEFTNPSINGLNPSRENSRSQSMTSEFIYNYSLEGVEGYPRTTPPPRPPEERGTRLSQNLDVRRRAGGYGSTPGNRNRGPYQQRPGSGSGEKSGPYSAPPVPRISSSFGKPSSRQLQTEFQKSSYLDGSGNYSLYPPMQPCPSNEHTLRSTPTPIPPPQSPTYLKEMLISQYKLDHQNHVFQTNIANSRSVPEVALSMLTVPESDTGGSIHEQNNSPPSPTFTPVPPDSLSSSPESNSKIRLVKQMMKSSAPIMPGPTSDRCYYKDLTIVQEECIMGHDDRVLKRTENLHHRVGCMICGDGAGVNTSEHDPTELITIYLWLCSWCALRICGDCKSKMREEQRKLTNNTSVSIKVDLKALRGQVLAEMGGDPELHPAGTMPTIEIDAQPELVTCHTDQIASVKRAPPAEAEGEDNLSEAIPSEVYRTANSTPTPTPTPTPMPMPLEPKHNPQIEKQTSTNLERSTTPMPMPTPTPMSLEPKHNPQIEKQTSTNLERSTILSTRLRDSGVAIRGDSEESIYQSVDNTESRLINVYGQDDHEDDGLVMRGRGASSKNLSHQEEVVVVYRQAASIIKPEEKPCPLNIKRLAKQNSDSFPPRKSSLLPQLQKEDTTNNIQPASIENYVKATAIFEQKSAQGASSDALATPKGVPQQLPLLSRTSQDQEKNLGDERLHDPELSSLLSSSLAVLYNLHIQPNDSVPDQNRSSPIPGISSPQTLPVVTSPSPLVRKKPLPVEATHTLQVRPETPQAKSAACSPLSASPISPNVIKRKPVANSLTRVNNGDNPKEGSPRGSSTFSGVFSLDRVKSSESSASAFSGLSFGSKSKLKETVGAKYSANKTAPFLLPPLEFGTAAKAKAEVDITAGLFGINGALGVGTPGSPERANVGLGDSTGLNGSANPHLYSPVGQMMGNRNPYGAPVIPGKMEKSKRWFKGLFG